MDFYELNPDQIPNEELDTVCQAAIESDLVNHCLNPQFVRTLLGNTNPERRRDGLWQIHGAAVKRRHRAAHEQRDNARVFPHAATPNSNPRHAAARAKRREHGALGRTTSAKDARSLSKGKGKAKSKKAA